MTSILAVLLVFMIVAAITAVMTADLLSAVISMGALGFAASIAFIMMKAPDVGIVMVIVEVLALILYIRATIGMGVKTVSGTRDAFGAAVGVVLIVLLGVFAAKVAHELPKVGEPAMARNPDAPANHYIKNSLKETGAGNAVMGVLLDYRGYDTLGEATVLFAAVLGAVVLLRTRARKRAPSRGGRGTAGDDPPAGRSPSAGEGPSSAGLLRRSGRHGCEGRIAGTATEGEGA